MFLAISTYNIIKIIYPLGQPRSKFNAIDLYDKISYPQLDKFLVTFKSRVIRIHKTGHECFFIYFFNVYFFRINLPILLR